MRRVAVVIPTHDRRDLLASTLASVLAQEGVDLDVVVVDDGSSDGTGEWLRSIVDPRVRVVTRDGGGSAAAARNAGLAAVDAPWVAFCDDDDLWAPGKLAAQLDVLEASPGAGWCAAGAVCIDEAMRVIEVQRLREGGEVLDRVLVGNPIPGGGSGVVARTELVRRVGGFDESLASSEDWDLWIRLAAAAPLAVADRPLVAYRVWSGGKSRRVVRMAAAYSATVSRYRALSSERGVVHDPLAHRRFLARQQVRSGDRLGAAGTFLSLARAGGPAHVLRAVASLVAPRLYDRFATARVLRAAPDGWVAEAERWLAGLGLAAASSGSR